MITKKEELELYKSGYNFAEEERSILDITCKVQGRLLNEAIKNIQRKIKEIKMLRESVYILIGCMVAMLIIIAILASKITL